MHKPDIIDCFLTYNFDRVHRSNTNIEITTFFNYSICTLAIFFLRLSSQSFYLLDFVFCSTE